MSGFPQTSPLVEKGPFRFTYANAAGLLTGEPLWTAAAGDTPLAIICSVPVTPFDGGTGANVTADSAPSLPLVVTSLNDTFKYTGSGGAGTPETFTIASGTYTTLAALEAAVGAATGSVSGEAFSTKVAVTGSGGKLIFTMKTAGVPAAPQNGNTITEGNGGAAAIGVTSPPDTFSGGAGPQVEILLGTNQVGSSLDISVIDVPNEAGTPGFGKSQLFYTAFFSLQSYILAVAAGLEYYLQFTSNPGTLTQGEVYVYALLLPTFYKVT